MRSRMGEEKENYTKFDSPGTETAGKIRRAAVDRRQHAHRKKLIPKNLLMRIAGF